METKKMSLAAIKGKLSRAEMKNIMAGSGSRPCKTGACTLYVGGVTYNGTCSSDWGGGSGGYIACGCETPYGVYNPSNNGGVSACYV